MDDQPAQPGEFAQQLANLENFRPAIGEVVYQSAYTALIQQRGAAPAQSGDDMVGGKQNKAKIGRVGGGSR